MNQSFVSILQQLIAEQGKEALLNPAKCKAFLADYTKGEYKKESRLLLQALEAGVQKAIDATGELELCKQQQARILQEEHFLAAEAAADVVDTLALVLREGQKSETPQSTVCANCGKELQKEWLSCPYCGTPVAKIQQNPPQTMPSPAPVVQAPSPTPAWSSPTPAPFVQTPSPPPPPKEKHPVRNAFIVIVIIVVGWIIIKELNSGPSYSGQSSAPAAASANANQENAKTFYFKGLSYFSNAEYDNAIKQFDEAIRLNSNYTEAYYYRGASNLWKNQYDAAIRDFDNAIKLNQNYAWAYHNRGEAYRMKGQYDTAIKDFGDAIRLNPNSAWAYGRRGQAYRQLGQRDQAIQDLEKAVSLPPNLEWARQELKELRGY